MLDRTSVGISPLLSTPVTTSFVSTPAVQTTSFVPGAVSQPLTFAQSSVPVASTFTTQVVDQGLAVPATTASYVPDPGFGVSVVPQATLPDQGFTTVIPDATPSYIPTPDLQSVSVVPDAGLQAIQSQALPVASTIATPGPVLASGITPEMVSSNPLAQTTGTYTTTTTGGTPVPPPAPQNAPIGPIMDEDFQRGRPIYDTFSEDRYRGFRFGR